MYYYIKYYEIKHLTQKRFVVIVSILQPLFSHMNFKFEFKIKPKLNE